MRPPNNTPPGQSKRILLAVLISFIFFIAYDYFFIPKKPLGEQNASVATTQSLEDNQSVELSSEKMAPQVAPSANLSDTQNLSEALPTSQNNESFASNKQIATISSEYFEAKIDSLGRISSFILKDSKYKDDKGSQINIIATDATTLPLELRFKDTSLNAKAFATAYKADNESVILKENESKTLNLVQDLGDVVVTKSLTFYEKGNYEIKLSLSKNAAFFITPGSRPNVVADAYTVQGALIYDSDEKIHTFEEGDIKADELFSNAIIASAFDRYYTSFFYSFEKPMSLSVSKDKNDNPLIFAYGENALSLGAYIGSKEHSVLQSIDDRLKNVVEYGWFSFIAKPMFDFLNFLHNYLGNWGWAIVVLTLIVRIILFPLTYKSMMSMNKLKDLAPKMKELREKYKGEPQKMNMHMMELYKKHGANPMSGCLPILLQIPIFFAIYRVLLNAIELKAAPWAFWIHDLSVMDPYFILPILMGATMFLQQLITPMAIQDPMQAKIMKFLPIIFTFFFITFPAGLTLYWFINNLCSIAQQAIINKLFKAHKTGQIAEHKHEKAVK